MIKELIKCGKDILEVYSDICYILNKHRSFKLML